MPRELALTSAEHGPPQVPRVSPESEACVLGAALIEADAAARVVDEVPRHWFQSERHRLIWDALSRLVQRRDAVDEVTLSEALRDLGTLEAAGGIPYVVRLTNAIPSAANLDYHIRRLRELDDRRRMLAVGQGVVDLALHDARDIADLVDRAGAAVFALSQAQERRGFVDLHSLLWPAMERVEARGRSGSAVTGTPSGFSDLDALTAGFQPGDLVILGARPSQGKTAITLGITQHVTLSARKPVGFFSLEMSKESLVERMLASEARVDGMRIRTGRLRDDDYPRLAQAAGLLHAAPVFIDDTPAISILEMRSKARRLKSDHPELALLVVDYLQLMRGDGENRTQVVSEVSRGLKALAKELHVPVIALSQLSRAVESRPDKRPMMSDLRESGSIEQDADLILFLYRPEVYFGAVDKDGNNLEGRAEVIIGKQRNGATGTVPLVFRKEFTRFESYSNRKGES
jgi:replicative DNA helicase